MDNKLGVFLGEQVPGSYLWRGEAGLKAAENIPPVIYEAVDNLNGKNPAILKGLITEHYGDSPLRDFCVGLEHERLIGSTRFDSFPAEKQNMLVAAVLCAQIKKEEEKKMIIIARNYDDKHKKGMVPKVGEQGSIGYENVNKRIERYMEILNSGRLKCGELEEIGKLYDIEIKLQA